MAKKLQLIGGARGKSAYQYALDGGYTGSEAEFKEKMARELEVSYDYEDLNEKILASAIKPEVSGTVISISDAAAIPLLGLDYEGENVTFTMCGKNILSTNPSDWYKRKGSNHYQCDLLIPETIEYITMTIKSKDLTNYPVDKIAFGDTKSLNAWMSGETITQPKNKLNAVYISTPLTPKTVFEYYDICVELGSTATDYEPYTAKTITVASPDKLNLNDFVMNNPNTIITNDQNVPMTIQYVADTQTYVENLAGSLTNAVVSLGGEV